MSVPFTGKLKLSTSKIKKIVPAEISDDNVAIPDSDPIVATAENEKTAIDNSTTIQTNNSTIEDEKKESFPIVPNATHRIEASVIASNDIIPVVPKGISMEIEIYQPEIGKSKPANAESNTPITKEVETLMQTPIQDSSKEILVQRKRDYSSSESVDNEQIDLQVNGKETTDDDGKTQDFDSAAAIVMGNVGMNNYPSINTSTSIPTTDIVILPKSSLILVETNINTITNTAADVTRALLHDMKELENQNLSSDVGAENLNLLFRVQKSSRKYFDTVNKFIKEVKTSISGYEDYLTQTTMKKKLCEYIHNNLRPRIFLPMSGTKTMGGVSTSAYENIGKLKVIFPFLVDFFKLGDYIDDDSFNQELSNLFEPRIFMYHGLEKKLVTHQISSVFINYEFELDASGNIIDSFDSNEGMPVKKGNNSDLDLQPQEVKNVKFLQHMYELYQERNTSFNDVNVFNYDSYLMKKQVFTPINFLKSWLNTCEQFQPTVRNFKKGSHYLPYLSDFFLFDVRGNSVTFFNLGNKLRRSYRDVFEEVLCYDLDICFSVLIITLFIIICSITSICLIILLAMKYFN